MKTVITFLLLTLTTILFGQQVTITEQVILYNEIKLYEEVLQISNSSELSRIKGIYGKSGDILDYVANDFENAKKYKDSIYEASKLEFKKNPTGLMMFSTYLSKSDEASEEKVALPVFGSEWQSTVVMGLTDFLLNRAKDEFTYAFIDDIKKVFEFKSYSQKIQIKNGEKDKEYELLIEGGEVYIDGNRYDTTKSSIDIKKVTIDLSDDNKKTIKNSLKEYEKLNSAQKFLQISFSNFYTIINKTDQFTYKNYVPAIRAAIIEDYNNLPYSLVRTGIALDTHINMDTKEMLKVSFDRVEEIIKGDNPFLALSKMSNSKDLTITNENIKVGFQIIGILAREQYYIMNTKTEIGSLNLEVLQDLLKDTELRTVFLRLLDKELNQKVTIYRDIHKEFAILEISKCFDNINKIVKEINSTKTDTLNSQKLINYLSSITSTFIAVNTIFDKSETEWSKSIGVMDTLINIQKSVIEKNYNQTIVLTTSLIKPELTDSKVFRIMSLTANLAEVKNKEDVEIALKTFADPVGSFRTKRIKGEKNRWSVSLNSYLGYNIGNEWLISSNDEINNKSSAYQSVYLPVGFEIDWATNWNTVSTIGLFASPIDLGTLASYRLNDQEWDSLSVSNSSEISFRTVLAPSATLVFGISKNKPITFSVGYQYAPEQRILKDNVLNIEDKLSVHHFFFNLALDLTLLKF